MSKLQRRVKKVAIDPIVLFDMFKTGNEVDFKIPEGIPAGSLYAGAGYEQHTGVVFIYVLHESFELIDHGQPIPYLDLTLQGSYHR
jgi:hypothetical protein